MRSPIKIHGGKYYLSDWIISHFPSNYREMNYYELFGGAASVLFKKDKSKTELYCELNRLTYCVFLIIKNDFLNFENFLRSLTYSRDTFDFYKNTDFTDDFQMAVKGFVLHKMSRGGMCKDFGWSDRLRGGKPEYLNSWFNTLDRLKDVSERLSTVHLVNDTWTNHLQDDKNALILLDPPYLPATRTASKVYQYEMDLSGHEDLVNRISRLTSKVILCGYDSELYNSLGWRKVNKCIKNHSSQSKVKNNRVECLWMNYD